VNIAKNNKPCSLNLGGNRRARNLFDRFYAREKGGRLIDPDHDIARFDDRVHRHALRQFQLVRRLIGDRGRQRRSAYVDSNMGRGLALLYLGDRSLELIARTDLR
jgi:hypothetical protein